MSRKLVVVTDLGSFKAYALNDPDFNGTPRLELIEEFCNVDAHGRLVDKVTDLAGRFKHSGNGGTGERHNMQLEQRRRAVKHLAGRLGELLSDSECEGCFLATSREINHQLIEELPTRAREKIQKNISADLTKLGRADLMGYFSEQPRLWRAG